MTTNRFALLVTLSVIAIFAVLSMSMLGSARHVTASTAYDQVELVRAQRYEAVAAQQAFLDQRRGEWTAGVDSAAAYLDYRRGEWNGK